MQRDTRVLANIERFGCHVIHVLPTADEEGPPFAHSVGIEHAIQRPEVVVIGLKQPLAHSVVNAYCKRATQGEQFESGMRASGFIGGFDCEVRAVHVSHYAGYFGQNLRFYGGPTFRTVQLVYPTTSGVWPWDPAVDEWFRDRQPVLDVIDES